MSYANHYACKISDFLITTLCVNVVSLQEKDSSKEETLLVGLAVYFLHSCKIIKQCFLFKHQLQNFYNTK